MLKPLVGDLRDLTVTIIFGAQRDTLGVGT